ncbi:hypothetical protein DR64_2415 [Paraburkholderia xenovorans LB400]|nr:hypothetical protein DR64_2415 [Paraburkholderia xenovorans LB400]
MPVWSVAGISAEPELSISEWQILETQLGSRHFVGIDVRDCTGRVSTAIQQFDSTALRGVTSSGRVYQLVGSQGCSSNGQYIWERWCIVNGITSYTDVTADVLVEGKI